MKIRSWIKITHFVIGVNLFSPNVTKHVYGKYMENG